MGWLLPPSWPSSPPSCEILSTHPDTSQHRENGWGGVTPPSWGRLFSLSPEALGGLKSSQTDPSLDPTKGTQVLSSDGANFYHFLEAPEGNGPHQACGSVQVLSFQLLQCGCDARMVPGAISRGIRATTGFSNSIL